MQSYFTLCHPVGMIESIFSLFLIGKHSLQMHANAAPHCSCLILEKNINKGHNINDIKNINL